MKTGRVESRVAFVLLCASLAAGAGCGGPGLSTEFDVGHHHIRFAIPRGWQVLEEDQRLVLRHEASQIVMADLGPAGPSDIRREVEQARQMWRDGRSRDARWRMRSVWVPRHLFETESQRRTFWDAWARVSGAPEDAGFATVEESFDAILAALAEFQPRDLDALIGTELAEIDHHPLGSVFHRRTVSIGGRDGVLVDVANTHGAGTTHRIALVLNHGHVLALRTEWGDARPMNAALDEMLETLEFGSTEPAFVSRPTPEAPTPH